MYAARHSPSVVPVPVLGCRPRGTGLSVDEAGRRRRRHLRHLTPLPSQLSGPGNGIRESF